MEIDLLPPLQTRHCYGRLKDLVTTSSVRQSSSHHSGRGLDKMNTPATEADTTDAATARRVLHHEADVVVVGAGIIGCAIAVALGKQGRSVLLLEKSLKEPDRIVGELLQPGGVAALETLGLKHCLEGIDSIRVRGYEVIYDGQHVHIPYPKNAAAPGHEVPKQERPEGRSFHHGRFIQQLRKAARETPNVTVVETKVTDLVESPFTKQILGVESETAGEADYYFAHLTIIADGYASKFRKRFIRHEVVSRSRFYGLELIDADLPRPEHGQVILSGQGQAPVLLYQIGTHETRALIDVPERTATASVERGGVKSHLRHVVLPSLPECVRPSFEAALDRGTSLRSMPNSFLPPSTNRAPGLILLGDAMNMRHPLTGGGMTVAFNDVVLLAELLDPAVVPSLDDLGRVRRQMSTFHWRRKRLSSVINILAQALYSLFAADDPQLKILQLGCFRYFQMGGQCIDGPVGLLAGIIRQPFVLFYHFFAVALYSIWLLVLTSLPSFGLSSSSSSSSFSSFSASDKSSSSPSLSSPDEMTGMTKADGETMGNGKGTVPSSEAAAAGMSSSSSMLSHQAPLVLLPFLLLIDSVRVFWKACVVIFPFIFSELRP